MTAREMQKEFERRVSLISPDLLIENKLTSDTIFSVLNQYQERYIKQLYVIQDQTETNTRTQKKVLDSIKSLLAFSTNKQAIQNSESNNISEFVLPEDYFLYIRSNSIVTSTYKGNVEESIIPNKVITEEEASDILTTPYNQVILREPCVLLNERIKLIHDSFTTVTGIQLVYYRKPRQFNVLNVDNITIMDKCELPESLHMEIVEGAVDMFITELKYKLQIKPNKEQQ